MILDNLPWYLKDLEALEGNIHLLLANRYYVIYFALEIPSLSDLSEQAIGFRIIIGRTYAYWRRCVWYPKSHIWRSIVGTLLCKGFR